MEPATQPVQKSKAKVFGSRLLSTILLWGSLSAGMIWGSPTVIISIICLFTIFGIAEYSFITLSKDAFRKWLLLLFSALWILGLGYVNRAGGIDLHHYDLIGFTLVIFLSFLPTLKREPSHTELQNISRFCFGFFYITFLFSFVLRIYSLPGGEENGVIWLLYLIAVSKFSDMGAYITGTLIGKNKMIPKISPGKTWEGFVGGILFSVGVSLLLLQIFPIQLSSLNISHAIILGILIALASVIADLSESILKRACNVKDSGNWLPGIGGVLDLIDSLLFSAPVLWCYLTWFG